MPYGLSNGPFSKAAGTNYLFSSRNTHNNSDSTV